jgi:hypothetical protein
VNAISELRAQAGDKVAASARPADGTALSAGAYVTSSIVAAVGSDASTEA